LPVSSIARVRTAALLAATAVLVLGLAAPAQTAPPKRVVALTPFTANILAGVGFRPVAIGQVLGGNDRFSSKLNGVPRLALSHPNGPNLEKLALYNPQLVLSAPTWRKGTRGMKGLGIKVVESDPQSANAAMADAQTISKLVGRAAAGSALAKRMRASIKRSKKSIKKHPSVLLVLGVGQTTFAFLSNSWGGDIVKQAGGKLITAGLHSSGGFARISDETVLARDPDVIIAIPHGDPSDLAKLATYLKTKPGWRKTTAAKKNHVYISTGNSLLQAFPDVGRTITDVRTKYLHN
jgi:iron complex transport system substrate-binding protein